MTRRLFWVGVGVTITIVVIRRGRRVVARYTPEAVAERAGDLGRDVSRRSATFVTTFRREFTAARSAREAELVAALLAEGQPHPDEVRARRSAHGRHAAAPDPEAATRADEEELGYSF
ncbi:hypothetical protein [Isoptericola aurantiacus]|uniref:hypothetical protein n=1 Tax=Isoptericola aurantiacus TaxID=3377839 RepID=UPI00383BE76C